MRFTLQLVALFSVLGTGAFAVSLPRQTCNIVECVAALGPLLTECASAALELGLDPDANRECLDAAAKDVEHLPAACSGCVTI
ncbi:hypothetical protein C8R45DRAFT_1175588 [Mycena sanguinolenta]|nr:hypothetical protein C8R45DRAFT_1175588 [Mycena sanguinolenta]